MNRKRRLAALCLLVAGFLGCDKPIEDSKTIDLKNIPTKVMDVAKQELPGVEFEQAWVGKSDGEEAFEIRGRNDRGKTREVRISASGKVLEKE